MARYGRAAQWSAGPSTGPSTGPSAGSRERRAAMAGGRGLPVRQPGLRRAAGHSQPRRLRAVRMGVGGHRRDDGLDGGHNRGLRAPGTPHPGPARRRPRGHRGPAAQHPGAAAPAGHAARGDAGDRDLGGGTGAGLGGAVRQASGPGRRGVPNGAASRAGSPTRSCVPWPNCTSTAGRTASRYGWAIPWSAARSGSASAASSAETPCSAGIRTRRGARWRTWPPGWKRPAACSSTRSGTAVPATAGPAAPGLERADDLGQRGERALGGDQV
jgi:hypothetical protein